MQELFRNYLIQPTGVPCVLHIVSPARNLRLGFPEEEFLCWGCLKPAITFRSKRISMSRLTNPKCAEGVFLPWLPWNEGYM